jgi:hypothetical protein
MPGLEIEQFGQAFGPHDRPRQRGGAERGSVSAAVTGEDTAVRSSNSVARRHAQSEEAAPREQPEGKDGRASDDRADVARGEVTTDHLAPASVM